MPGEYQIEYVMEVDPELVLTALGLDAAGAGLVGGGVYAVLRQGPTLRWAFATSVSCAICEGTFAGEALEEQGNLIWKYDDQPQSSAR
jgi:hypothetical protein